MEYTLQITDFAQATIEEIITWYVLNESVIRADKVRASLYAMIKKVSESPFAFKIYENTFYPRPTLRYAVVYKIHAIVFEIKGTIIVIMDVFDLRRNPALFKK